MNPVARESESAPDDALRFYFSFRSPYAWLAAERLEEDFGDLGVPIEQIPIFPTPGLFPNDPTSIPDKIRHLTQDIRRLARERGMTVRFPRSSDCDWVISHAGHLRAKQLGGGLGFMLEVFRKRFAEGLDLGDRDVIADASRRASLDPTEILAAAEDETLHSQATNGFRLAMERDHVFGVPSFVYAEKLYWGQDRMHFVRDAILRKSPSGS